MPDDTKNSKFKIGFDEKKYVDFGTTFSFDRNSLNERKELLRKGRLNDIAYEHYRESMAQYFRRYPYEEHYSLNNEELKGYEELRKDMVKHRFPWQEENTKVT